MALSVIALTILLAVGGIDSWTATRSNGGHRLVDTKFTRFQNLFNSDQNASLYIPRLDDFRRRTDDETTTTTTILPPASMNETRGRALDLNALLGESSSQENNSG